MALAELEKITINMGPMDLGQIDLLVREGFYQNRTDLIRTGRFATSSARTLRRSSRRSSVRSWCSGCSTTRATIWRQCARPAKH